MHEMLCRKIQIDDKLYDIVKGNNGEVDCVSFFNSETQLFLRHKAGKICENDSTVNPDYFRMDSSFIFEEFDGRFLVHCSNPGMENQYILHQKF